MLIYCVSEIKKNIQDLTNEYTSDEYIYSPNGIYKKYKYHFYKLDIENDITIYNYKNNDFYIQNNYYNINKNNIITTIPYQHYHVIRKTYKTNIDDNIIWIKEVDNDIFTNEYFETNISLYDALEKISLFLNNKL